MVILSIPILVKGMIKKRRINLGRVIFLFASIVFIIFIFLISPIFQIREIYVMGNAKLSEDSILAKFDVNLGSNILSFSSQSAENRIKTFARVENASIYRQFPGKIIINITERQNLAAIKIHNNYIIVDNAAMVIDVLDYAPDDLIIVNGLMFSNFGLGAYLEIKNENSFQVISIISNAFLIHELSPDSIDLHDINDIQLNFGDLTVLFGNINDLNRKTAAAIAILDYLLAENNELRGFIHIQDINISPRFGLLR